MAGSEYEQYVNSRKEDESSSGLGNAIKVGALIGAGALGYRYRRELGSGIRTLGAGAMSVTNRGVARLARSETLKDRISQTGSFLKAMDHALDMKSPVFHLQNRQRFNNRFDDSMRRSLTELEKRKQGVMRRTPTQIEQSLDTLRHNRKMGDFMTERALRFNASMDALNKKMPDRMQGGLRDILNNMSDDFFNDPSKGKIRGLLDSYSPENAKKNNFAFNIPIKSDSEKSQFVDEMFEVLDTFRDTKALRKEDVKASKKKMRDNMYDGFMRQHKKEDTFFTKMMEKQGWKQATVEDLLMHKTGGKMDSGSIRLPKKDGSHFEARMNSKLSKLMKLDPKVGDLVADPNLYVNPRGEMLDLRKAAETTWKGLAGFRDNFQIPFLRFNPLDLMHFTSFQAVKEAPQTYFMRRGTIDVKTGISKNIETVRHPMAHNQDAKVGPLGKEYVYMSGNVYDVGSGDLVETGKYLASGRFGMYPRALSGMANLHRKDYRDRGFLGKLFDVGKQENEAVWSRMASTVTKFKDENWERNYKTLIASGKTEEAYKNVYAMLEQHTAPMSDDTISHISSQVKKAYGKLDIDIENMRSPEEVMTTLGKLNEATMLPNSGVVQNKELSLQINQFWAQYRNNPTEFMKNQRIKTDHMPYVPEALSALDMHETNMIDKLDDVKRLIHQHAIAQVEFANSNASKVTVGSLVREGIRNGQLETNAMSEVRGLDVLTSMRSYWDDVYKNGPLEKNAALDQFANTVMDESKPFVHALDQTIKEQTPWYSMGTGDAPPQYFGYVGYQTMDKAKGAKWMLENFNKQYQNGESPIKAGVNSLMGVLGQPFAGRKNIQDVTTATLPFYYFAERLDNAISQAGLGLSQQNRGSMQSILMNQFGRRIVLPYVAYKQAQYFDDMTGDVVSDKLGETYVNMHEDVGRIKEIFGLNKIGEDLASILPGIEQLGEITPIKMFNFATMGAFFDNRSGEEIREYYEDGEDAIRKGRFWGIGSGTPWQGGKIERFEPNWYRKMKSDYQYTDTMYGSSSEYWANHWMPTLTHPLAPLKHFLLDPNHWANKHKDDRPYPITGGITELESIALVGPLLNATVGRVINPTRVDSRLEKSHREYLEEVNEHIKSQYDQATSGGSLQFMPAGGYEIIDGNIGGGEAGSGDGYGYGDGSGTGGGDGTPVVTASDVGGASGGSGASGDLRASLTIMNKAYSENGGPALGSGGSPIRSITGLNDLRDPDMVSDLKDIGQITDASGIARDAFYSLSEVAGIYGFSVKAAMGWEESGRGVTFENASRMTSYARAWWDLEMGGMGGQLSEIGRRYVPRDPNKRYYNPIRNEMPDWMPGVEYFTDFQHGDPFVKVSKGEMRLPGEAYETLNKLHPDAFGEYGAFDRFKILGDVAPYSSQYKFYKGIVSQMNQEGLLDESMQKQYKKIRDQVSARKDKYNFYNRRFDNADIYQEEVTITKIIDQNTFLTKEHPNNPIKLAGVSIKADDEETQAWLRQYIYEGATVKVGLDSDPLYRVRDDMMNTMRAVVYAGERSEGMPFYMSEKGQNLNYMLANRSSGGFMGIGGEKTVSVKDDGSATSTQALYSNDQITVGKIWEYLTHDILPQAPIVGTVADKFLQIRSPLEEYKRTQIYGKAWKPWEEPISGWVEPMLDTIRERHPLVAAAEGYGIGWLFGRKGRGKYYGKWVGAIIGGGLSASRVFGEAISSMTPGKSGYDDTWMPERRRKEREINEYFDRLKYMKFKGLYEKTRQEALKQEGIDIEKVIGDGANKGKQNKQERRFADSVKKWLSISKKIGYGDEEQIKSQLSEIRDRMKIIDEDRPNVEVGPLAMLALRYKAEYESTLYGADPNGDMTKIFRALPSKDREFFTEFMKAAPGEREEILRLVPKDQKRFYQAKWGLDVDDPESLGSYFSDHYLPDANWEGWKPNVDLESIKLKVVKNEALELTEFGLWGDDETRAMESGVDSIDIDRPTLGSRIDVGRIESILRGSGLKDVSVSMNVSSGQSESKVDIGMNILRDRTEELASEIKENISSIFS